MTAPLMPAAPLPIEPAARKIAAITRQPGSAPFQTAAEQGRFVVPRCGACSRLHWYPRAFCPFCLSRDIAWTEASGQGTVYSYTVMRRVNPVYAVAYVQLAEGPTMMSNLVDADFDALRIGMPVRLVFQAAENGPLVPMFRPA